MDSENGISSPCSTQKNPSSTSSHKRKAGRKKFQETRHPLFRGVRRRNGDKWVCEVREPNKKSRIWLGTYTSPEMAARAHDVAALALRGNSATLNFPDSAQILPVATSSSANDIRAAVAEATFALESTTISSSKSEDNKKLFKGNNEEGEESGGGGGDEGRKLFMDEEALYNMPSLLLHMAEGLLLSPPSMFLRALGFGLDDDDFTFQFDLTLWPNDDSS